MSYSLVDSLLPLGLNDEIDDPGACYLDDYILYSTDSVNFDS